MENSPSLINQICRQVQPVDESWLTAASKRQLTLTKPPGSLGRLEEIGNRLAAIQQTVTPRIAAKRIYVVAGDHGVTTEGVSAFPREVTAQMVDNFLRGGAAINVLGRNGGIEVKIVDAGVDADLSDRGELIQLKVMRGTANFALGPAMTRQQAELCIVSGVRLARHARSEGIDLIGIGDMGIGNTTAASAITAALTGTNTDSVTGRGTGIDDVHLAHKVETIRRALTENKPDRSDPIDILAKVGGTEIGVMMGIVLGAAAERLPVVADGFISTAAAALTVGICPHARDYLFAAHRSSEPGHSTLIDYIGHQPLLDLSMRLGEGTGAALAMHIIDAASKLLSEMATFKEAGVSDKE
ncbi:MAG: nicotinate-nucleotide--dimethylbenzimidazole phosphoribosyltransferase [Acidobacteriales bacterium]|nr:nicotinate-nucleotide--dimethylbenzimidazole phosphoribosyltransferase [Terriglobales bacterium]